MSMFQLDLLVQFSILFEIAVALLFIFCLKLKSSLYKYIFPTIAADAAPRLLPWLISCTTAAAHRSPQMTRPKDQDHPPKNLPLSSLDQRELHSAVAIRVWRLDVATMDEPPNLFIKKIPWQRKSWIHDRFNITLLNWRARFAMCQYNEIIHFPSGNFLFLSCIQFEPLI